LVLERATGLSQAMGAFLAMLATVGYFALGGLKSAALVNRIQLIVILAGFAIAAPMAGRAAGGLFVSGADSQFWSAPGVGWQSLLLLGPAFCLSPGLLQKAYGARSSDALTRGVAWSGVILMIFAWLPVLLGMAARQLHPDLASAEMALPAVLAADVPLAVGSFALAAVLSAEISSADAVLFMLATSGARDFYRGILRPDASDAAVLSVARWLALIGGFAGFALTFYFDSVVSAITLFYQTMIVTLFAPILGGLVLPKAGRWSALAAMLVGMATLIVTGIATNGVGWAGMPPHFLGLVASGLVYFLLAAF
jgi:SSS family solute:Na+ symporter